MKCINFDERFADFTAKWMKEHRGEYKTYDEMEDDLPRVYTEFLNMPAKWLDGVTPGAYFMQFEDAKDLVDWMVQYCQKDIPVPDMLMEQIQAVGRPCEKRLLTLLRDESDAIPEEARMTAIGLLRDMGSTLPKMLYIQWQLNREMKDDLADNALDSLRDMGKEALQPMLENLNKANEAGQEALLDVLANFPGHENVYQLAVRLFEKNPNRRALFASYLAKLGDPRALPVLIAAANEENCRYMDFIELRAAIEELGLKDLTIAATSLGSAHDPIAAYIEEGKVVGIQTSGIRGKMGEVVSAGKLKTPAIIRSHGGRPRAIEGGEVHIDIAFVAAPTSDQMGNCRGVGGKSDCGSLGYAMTDAKYADHVVVVTDCLVDFPNFPASVEAIDVDAVVVVDSIGNPKKIASAAARISPARSRRWISGNSADRPQGVYWLIREKSTVPGPNSAATQSITALA